MELVVAISIGVALVLAVVIWFCLETTEIVGDIRETVRRVVSGKFNFAGKEGMLGETAEVCSPFSGLEGRVRFGAEIWQAKLEAEASPALSPGDFVEIISVEGLTLTVKRKQTLGGNE